MVSSFQDLSPASSGFTTIVAPPSYHSSISTQGGNSKYIKFRKSAMKGTNESNPIVSMEDMTSIDIKDMNSTASKGRTVKTILDYLPDGFYAIEYAKRRLNYQEHINGTNTEWGLLDLYCHKYRSAVGVVFVQREIDPGRALYNPPPPPMIYGKEPTQQKRPGGLKRMINRVSQRGSDDKDRL